MKKGKKAVLRLSRYREALRGYLSFNRTMFFSRDLAKTLDLTSAQIRKDFSTFGVSGRKKVGYPVAGIIARIDEILDNKKIRNAVVCGYGNLGKAIIHDDVLLGANIRIVAAFDDRVEEQKNAAVPLLHLDNLPRTVTEHKVEFGIIAATNGMAQQYLDHLVICGIRGILSLSPTELKAPAACVVNRINIAQEMKSVIYFADRRAAASRAHSDPHDKERIDAYGKATSNR